MGILSCCGKGEGQVELEKCLQTMEGDEWKGVYLLCSNRCLNTLLTEEVETVLDHGGIRDGPHADTAREVF